MRFHSIFAFTASTLFSGVFAAACSSNLVIDSFAKWSSNTNSLGSWTSDDGTMTKISAANGVLSFIPSTSSYFYESFPCEAATTDQYNAIQFTIQAPMSGASLSLELQTQTSCSATKYTSYYYTVSGLTGQSQTVSVLLSSFGTKANLNAIVSIVWEGFSSTGTSWSLSNIQFVCANVKTLTGILSVATSPTTLNKSTTSSVTLTSTATTTTSPTSTKTSLTSTIIQSSTTITSSSIHSSTTTTLQTSTTSSSVTAVGTSNVVVEDFASQSRLTFLFYNALLQPSGDDGTMKSIVVGSPSANRGTFTPTNANSYFYSQLNCFNAGTTYGGISLRITAPAGSSFTVEMGFLKDCTQNSPTTIDVTTKSLGWTFDGTEKLYSLKWSQFAGLDVTKLNHILITGFSKAIVLGPISIYYGNTPSEYVVAPTQSVTAPSSTVPAPIGTAAAKIIDKFGNKNTNALGFWHGYDDGLTVTWGTNKVTITSSDPDYAFYTQVSSSCSDFTSYEETYLHIAYSGSTSFSIALQQHNPTCNENLNPYPATWDEVEAGRYANNGNIYVPLSHFKIDKTKTIGFALKGWYTTASTSFTLVEIVDSVPSGWQVESKLPTGNLIFSCTRPNSFAFCIDDGDPTLAQQVMQIVKEEDIKVTFFTLGAPLMDPTTNLSNVYKEMQTLGHQIAVHSYTHPKMEGLADYAEIDWEYNNDMAIVGQIFGTQPKYFRPPFGTEGARMRYRWATHAGDDNAPIVMWSVDIQDWVWATTDTPQNQITAFEGDVDKGGTISVAHYLYPSTVSYFQQLIQYVKSKGYTLMRLDQCMEDPNAPPL